MKRISPAFAKTLDVLLRLPTAPFHEHAVMGCVLELLGGLGVPFLRDSCGNIVARLKRGAGKNCPIALVAHMDHPGFLVEAGGAQPSGRPLQKRGG